MMNNIALAFSGGGFRAACFSLGSLSYLNRLKYGPEGKPLLENVTFISSTSGGSITNLAYSAAVFKGVAFAEFYKSLLSNLEGQTLLDDATGALISSKAWKGREDKSRNLINAFSLIYDRWLDGATFDLFSDRSRDPHLEEICINATEFTNGLPFRFQSQNPKLISQNGFVGNFFIHFDKKKPEIPGSIKLADILASSSCFPSGFEPIIFPEDFTHEGLTIKELRDALQYTANTFTLQHIDSKQQPGSGQQGSDEPVAGLGQLRTGEQILRRDLKYGNLDPFRDKRFAEEFHVGIMDGGVDDNQAINAFEQAWQRRHNGNLPQFDLFIACDVTSNFMDGYTLPLEKKRGLYALPIWPMLLLLLLGWSLLAVFLTRIVIIDTGGWTLATWVLAIGALVFDLPFVILVWGLIRKVFQKKKKPSSWGPMLRRYGPRFLRLSIGALLQMIVARIKSVFLLANDVYLKQIRRMYYHDIFTVDPRFKGMVIQNAIYDCSKIKFNVPNPPPGPRPSQQMIDMAETARMMGTTLWFDEKNKHDDTMKQIVVTGQFTTCYHLMRYIDALPTPLDPALITLRESLQDDWECFCKKADFMYA
jgi:Patatin-like phospholipase